MKMWQSFDHLSAAFVVLHWIDGNFIIKLFSRSSKFYALVKSGYATLWTSISLQTGVINLKGGFCSWVCKKRYYFDCRRSTVSKGWIYEITQVEMMAVIGSYFWAFAFTNNIGYTDNGVPLSGLIGFVPQFQSQESHIYWENMCLSVQAGITNLGCGMDLKVSPTVRALSKISRGQNQKK